MGVCDEPLEASKVSGVDMSAVEDTTAEDEGRHFVTKDPIWESPLLDGR